MKKSVLCILAICAALSLTACQKETVAADLNESSDGSANVSGAIAAAPGKEWVYVPEIITVRDDRASYEDMQLIGDTVCYISMNGEAEGELQKICYYSLTDRELTQICPQWNVEEKNLEICSFVFNPDGSVWLIVNAYSADYSQLKRYLCRFDSEGKNLATRDIVQEMGRGSAIGDMAVDGQGRIYVFTSEYAESGEAGIWLYTDKGDYQGRLSFDTKETVLVKGTAEREDGGLYVCISKGEEPDHCRMLEIDFEGKRLTEAAEDFPNIKGLCQVERASGNSARPGGDLAGLAGDQAGPNEACASQAGELAGAKSVSASRAGEPTGPNGTYGSQTGNSAAANGDMAAGTPGTADTQAEKAAENPARPSEDASGLTEKYNLLLYDDKSVYGYNFPASGSGSGKEPEKLFAWADSDINGYFVESLKLLKDGRYYVTMEDWENEDRGIVLLRKTKAEDVIPRKDMVLAAVDGGSSLTALAVKFNRSQEQYHLELKSYDSLTDLYNAILTKEPMDLIDLSGVNVESLLRQGVFEDLRPYLEQSETLAPTDFVEGILDTYTIDGILAGIPESFTLRTMAGDRVLLGDVDGLTLEGLFAIAKRSPGALPVGEVTKNEMMQYLMMFNQDTFIDWETGECRFDTVQFQDVLEFANRFPDSLETIPGEDSLPQKIHDGQVLFAIADLYGLGSFQRYEGMFGEAVPCGFPTADGSGGTLLFPGNAFGVTAMSQHKDGAWKFIESVLDPKEAEQMEPEELVNSIRWQRNGLPSLKKIMDIMSEYRLEADRKWAEAGRSFGARIYDDGYVVEFHALTQEEVDIVLALVKDAKPYFSAEDDNVIKIINEEAPAYYSGQKGLEDVAKVIQNRVQLYVNENM